MSQGVEVDGEFLARVLAVCEAHGLRVNAARRVGVLLLLQPDTLEAMPEAEALRQIAEALAGDGVRYVALSIASRDGEDEA